MLLRISSNCRRSRVKSACELRHSCVKFYLLISLFSLLEEISGLLVTKIKVKMSMSFFQKKTMFGGLSRVFADIHFVDYISVI